MTCANCGTPQNDNEEICLACGAKYPEINNENKPTSKNKSKEVGNSSALFSIFDSKNDAMNITEHEENIFFDVLKNKKPKKEQKEKDNKEIKSNESKAKAPKEAKAVKKEKVQKVKDVKETVKSDIVQTQNSEIEEAQVVNNEPVQAIAQDENQVNVQVQIEAPIIDSFLPETVIDTENNVFKDSDDFNISLSDLDELEKSITKAKEENQEENQVVVFDEFDIVNVSNDSLVLESYEDIVEAEQEVLKTPEPKEDVLLDTDIDLDNILESLTDETNENKENKENKETTETFDELSESINNDTQEINDEAVDSDFVNVEILGESIVSEDDHSDLNNAQELNVDSNNESTDDFIKLDGVEDIINELNVEDIEDIDEFLAQNKSMGDIELEEIKFNNTTDASNNGDNEEFIYDFSLAELDNLEKMLIAEKESSPISDIESALLSGVDLIHEDLVMEKAISQEVNDNEQEVVEKSQEDMTELEKFSLDINNDEFGKISENKYDKVTKAFVLNKNDEPIDFLKENKKDFDINLDVINEIVNNVSKLKVEIDSFSEEFDEDVLQLEESLLEDVEYIKKQEKLENAQHIDDIENIEDVDLGDFVSVDEMIDADNIVKEDIDDNTQFTVDEIIQQAKLEAEILSQEENSEDEGLVQEDVNSDELKALESNTEENEAENQADNVANDGGVQETDTKQDIVEEVTETVQEATKTELTSNNDVPDFESEILSKTISNEEFGIQFDENSSDEDIDSLLLDVIGDFELVKPKQQEVDETKGEKSDFNPDETEVQEFIGNIEAVQGLKYDTELVQEYETLRMDLEMFFPNSQELEKLDKDIAQLLANSEVEELATQMEHDILLGDLGDYDFEELNDKEISDALLEIREMKEKEDNAKRRKVERQKKLRRGQEMFGKIYTYGGLFKKIDATIVHATIITLAIVGYAGFSTYKANSLTVNMQGRSEKISIADQLWDGLYDNANSYIELQEQMQNYVDGNVDQETMIRNLNIYIEENITARDKFETVDMPTYSEYKYKIDKFLSDRMIAANKALIDVTAGKTNSEAIQDLIKLKTDIESVEKAKEDFYKQMGISF